MPTRLNLLYGTADTIVTLNDQLKILKYFNCIETKLFVSKGSDHRMSSTKDLILLRRTLAHMIKDSI